jgi:beta-xylosidase
MVDSVMFWNEPNNKSHWDFEVDPDWSLFAQMVNLASDAVAAENPRLTKVLGGMSPIDPAFVNNLERKGVLDRMDAIAMHGFPLDWNHWQLNDWPEKLKEIQAVARRDVTSTDGERALSPLPRGEGIAGERASVVSSASRESSDGIFERDGIRASLSPRERAGVRENGTQSNPDAWHSTRVTEIPVWVSEVGISTFGAEEVQEFGLRRTAELLIGRAPRVHWYSLYDLPKAWPATTRHREAEGSAYYRHFYMGLLKEDGTPKLALKHFHEFTPELGICQWFHFEDHRLEDAVRWLKKLGVKQLRTGLSWADSFRPNCDAWFDRMILALDSFDVTTTFCFTPEHRGIRPHHTSAPQVLEEYAEFCARMVKRYAPGATISAAASTDLVTA